MDPNPQGCNHSWMYGEEYLGFACWHINEVSFDANEEVSHVGVNSLWGSDDEQVLDVSKYFIFCTDCGLEKLVDANFIEHQG